MDTSHSVQLTLALSAGVGIGLMIGVFFVGRRRALTSGSVRAAIKPMDEVGLIT